MALKNLSQLKPIFKDAFDKTLGVAKFFCGIHVVNSYLCTFALSQGPSMIPTLNLTGNLVLAERLSTRLGKVGNGDVVLIRSPIEPRTVIIKRVVAVEGDTVNYIASDDKKATTIVIPKGHIWIEGDNKPLSRDSRLYGPVPYGLLEGRVFWVMWPPEDFGSVGKRVQDLKDKGMVLSFKKSQMTRDGRWTTIYIETLMGEKISSKSLLLDQKQTPPDRYSCALQN